MLRVIVIDTRTGHQEREKSAGRFSVTLGKQGWEQAVWEKDLFHMPEREERERETGISKEEANWAPAELVREGGCEIAQLWLRAKVLSGTD